jgi:hypothetical protein
MIKLQAFAFIADANINFGSATVPVTLPEDASKIPMALFDLFNSSTLNCSHNSIFVLSQFSRKMLYASLDAFTFGRNDGLTFDLYVSRISATSNRLFTFVFSIIV